MVANNTITNLQSKHMYYTCLDVQRLWCADADFALAKGHTECSTDFYRKYTGVILQDHFYLE